MTERSLSAPREDTLAPGWRLPIAAYLAAGFGGLIALAVGTVLWLALGTARHNTYDLLRTTAELSHRREDCVKDLRSGVVQGALQRGARGTLVATAAELLG